MSNFWMERHGAKWADILRAETECTISANEATCSGSPECATLCLSALAHKITQIYTTIILQLFLIITVCVTAILVVDTSHYPAPPPPFPFRLPLLPKYLPALRYNLTPSPFNLYHPSVRSMLDDSIPENLFKSIHERSSNLKLQTTGLAYFNMDHNKRKMSMRITMRLGKNP